MLLIQLSPSHSINMVRCTALGTWQRVPQSVHLPYRVGESSFPCFAQPNYTVNSDPVVGIKPGDSGVVIGYQVDEFTHTCYVEHFIVQSHIYPGIMDKVSTLTHFPLELGCEDYSI